ncbi:DUR3-like protein, partial [Mya arenaria]
ISPSIPKSNAALLLLLGFGGFSILVAAAYKSLRKYVYHDEHNLDTVFDAGGRSGLGGTLWFSIGIIVDILLFPVLSIFLKTRAPGAKTFPQVLTKDVNNEFIFLVLAFLFGSYCMIGGLGTTFYISYFNTALTFLSVTVYVLYTSYFPSEESKEYSSMEALYKAAICVEAPETNYEQSHATFRTESGLIYGVVLLFMATSISFTDQANWQSRIAAKPTEGVLGFFMAAYLWFVIAPCLSVTATTTYFAMSLKNGTHLLSESEIDNGYITPFVMNFLHGETGGYLLLTMLMMALMSTGSGEVMAISSIVVYDIYKTYINPFRQKQLSESKMDGDFCACSSSIGCKSCDVDITTRARLGVDKVAYTCSVHGDYRRYEDGLMRYKSWCMVWVVILIVPYGLLISETDMNVNWATLGLQVLTCPFLVPLFLTITWSKATAKGVISGGILGLSASISGMLIMGSTYESGLSNFYVNTAQDYSLLTAMLSGFVVSGVVSVIVSLCTHNIRSEADANLEWAKTINIDNPINPFRLIYEEEFAKAEVGDIITATAMDKVFRKAKLYAGVLGIISLVIFVVILPAIALSSGVLSFDEFKAWIKGYQIYCFICTFVVVVLPPFEEGYQIWLRYQKNKRNETLSVFTAKQPDLNGESCRL